MTTDFVSLLECFDLKQHVDCSTHIKGHTLDLVISHGLFLSQFSVTDLGLSDHFAILFSMELSHTNISPFRTVNYRNWKSIDLNDFSAFIESSLSGLTLSDPLEVNISLLNTVLLSGLDLFAPMKSRSVAFVRSAPWYNGELRSRKAAGRKLERKWRTSGLNVHYQAWKDHLLEYKAEIVSVRSQYFSQIIDNNQNNPKKLFHTINKLFKGNSSSNVPASDQLCNGFLDHFSSKIANARKSITSVAFASAPSIPIFPALFSQILAYLILSLWVMWFHK